MTSPRLLLVEDSPVLVQLYTSFLDNEDCVCQQTDSGLEAIRVLQEQPPEIMLLDLNLPDINGLEVLEFVREHELPTSVIVVTGSGSVDMAVDAMRKGAFDFLEKPVQQERLIVTVRNALERNRLERIVDAYEENLGRTQYSGFIGASPAMQTVYRTIDSAAPSSAAIFVTGESGTGKELCARAVHENSTRASGPFVPLNCAAIAADLVESEIFGHVKGAFTGAVSDRPGAALSANGGTLFLDEICEMRLDLQSKLLRLIQTGEVQQVGSNKSHKVDIRFVCATNRSPFEEVRAGRFREDLLHRLQVIPMHLPPLRDRDSDVLILARNFLGEYARREGKAFERFHAAAEELIRAYEWPGNVRELQNIVQRVVVLNTGKVVSAGMMRDAIAESNCASALEPKATNQESVVHLPEAALSVAANDDEIVPLAKLKKRAIEQAVRACGGNIVRAAALLEVNPSTIYRNQGRSG